MVSYFTHGVTLAYRSYGSGPKALIALHGFGRTGEDFSVLEKTIGTAYTIHAFDLHFHGQSPSYPQRSEEPFTPGEMAVFFSAFADELKLEKISILGYSLGGRVALNLLEQMPERIERAFLTAPDGLKTRPWYRALASSGFGRWAYRRFVERPAGPVMIIDLLGATRLMSLKMHRFLKGQTDGRAKRMLLRDVWLSYRLIEPDLETVAMNAKKFEIPIHLIFGERDSVIKPSLGPNLRKYAPDMISQTELPFGHVLITPELGEAMRDMVR
ncbi:MAG: alpha/beta hydrolase [Flavobacteriales bacterium]